MKHTRLDRESIEALVREFYVRIQAHEELGPVFESKITGDAPWETHFATMTRFWSAVMLGIPGYKGNPVAKHAGVSKMRPEHFEAWFILWSKTTSDLFEDDIAEALTHRAAGIRQNLSSAVFGQPA